jgi:hypothetical protein
VIRAEVSGALLVMPIPTAKLKGELVYHVIGVLFLKP